MSIDDLVLAKKTQRDKDWPMIEQLVEAHYAAERHHATVEQIQFWLLQSRTPEILIELAASNTQICSQLKHQRKLLGAAEVADTQSLRKQLALEREREQEKDRLYWEPLKREMEQLRRNHGSNSPTSL